MKKTILATTLLLVFCSAEAQFKKGSPFVSRQKARSHQNEKTGFFGKKAALLPDSIESYEYNETNGTFDPMPSTVIYAYDVNGNISEEIKKDASGAFDTRRVYVHQGVLLTETHYYYWDGAWKLDEKEILLYNQSGVDTTQLRYSFDPLGDSILTYGWRVSMDFDNSNRPVTLRFYQFDDMSGWYPTERGTLYYTGSETAPHTVEMQEYDMDMDVWANSFRGTNLKWELGFDPRLENAPTVVLSQEWDGANWVNEDYDSTVVSNGNETDMYYHSYDEGSMAFEMYYSIHFTYDNQGSAIVHIEIEYDGGLGDTTEITLDTFEYGSSNEILNRVSYSDYSFSGLSGYKEIYYYTNTSYRIPEETTLRVYPNPVSSGQYIQLNMEEGPDQIAAYDSKGQLVKTWSLDETGQMATEGLRPGIYFLKASGKETQYTARLVVK